MCRDYGQRPDCLGTPNPTYTMDFSDIGEEPILWCDTCGPEAHALQELMYLMVDVKGEQYVADVLRQAIEGAEKERS